MFVLMKSRTNLKMGHVESKTRLLGQILEKPCVRFVGSQTRSLGQILENLVYALENSSSSDTH